jgi:hypothetical protein
VVASNERWCLIALEHAVAFGAPLNSGVMCTSGTSRNRVSLQVCVYLGLLLFASCQRAEPETKVGGEQEAPSGDQEVSSGNLHEFTEPPDAARSANRRPPFVGAWTGRLNAHYDSTSYRIHLNIGPVGQYGSILYEDLECTLVLESLEINSMFRGTIHRNAECPDAIYGAVRIADIDSFPLNLKHMQVFADAYHGVWLAQIELVE